MLSARQSPKAVAFYEAAFGAAEDLRLAGPSGAVVARLSIDGGKFWLAEESPEHRNFSPEMLGGGMVRMILNVPDPDASFERPGRRGGREVVAVKDDHGWRWAGWATRSATTGRSADRSTRDARTGFTVMLRASSAGRSDRRGRRSAAWPRGA